MKTWEIFVQLSGTNCINNFEKTVSVDTKKHKKTTHARIHDELWGGDTNSIYQLIDHFTVVAQ